MKLLCRNKTTQYLATASVAWFCTGIHMGWPSPSLPKILSVEYPFNVTTEEASYVTVISSVGNIVGVVVSSVLLDLIGRKYTILLIGVPQLVSLAMIYFSFYSVLMLYFGRLIGGLAEGACFTVLPIYICEILEPEIRGVLGLTYALSTNFGLLFTNLVGSSLSISSSALVYISCSLCFIVSFSIMPESPYYLIIRNKLQKAEDCLKHLRDYDVTIEFSSLTSDVARQMSEKGRYKDLFKIRSTLVMVVLLIVQQYSGQSVFGMYTQLLFKEATDALSEKWAAIIMLSVQSITTVFAMSFVDRVGRRPLLLVSIGGAFFTLTTNAVFFTVRDFSKVDVSNCTIFPLVVLMVHRVFSTLGLGTVVNLMTGELFPTSVKAKAAGLMNIVGAVGMLTSTKFYQFMTDHYSLMVPFAVFAGVQFMGFIFCWRLVRETKNKTLGAIQQG